MRFTPRPIAYLDRVDMRDANTKPKEEDVPLNSPEVTALAVTLLALTSAALLAILYVTRLNFAKWAVARRFRGPACNRLDRLSQTRVTPSERATYATASHMTQPVSQPDGRGSAQAAPRIPVRPRKPSPLAVLLVLLTLLHLWLMTNAPYAVTPEHRHDHEMLFKYATYLSEGKWLGTYSNLTLAKGMGYSAFLALGRFAGLPYGPSFGLYVAVTSMAFAISLRPWVRSRYVRAAAYVFMLFCPVARSYVLGLGVYRNAMVPWSVLGHVSGVIGIYSRIGEPEYGRGSMLAWGAFGGANLAFFWILREDSFWILPFAVVSTAVIVVKQLLRREDRLADHATVIAAVSMPLLLCLVLTQAIAQRNYQEYDIRELSDRTATPFADVLSDLHHIDDGQALRDVWISRKQLDLAMRESPTLASMREGIIAYWNMWAQGDDVELPGDTGQWALRDGVAEGGHYVDAAEAATTYQQIHEELQSALSEGRLPQKQGIYLSSQARALDMGDFTESLAIAVRVWHNISTYHCCQSEETVVQSDDAQEISLCEQYLSVYGVKSDKYLAAVGAGEDTVAWNAFNETAKRVVVRISNLIWRLYGIFGNVWVLLMWACYVALTARVIRNARRKAPDKTAFSVWLLTTGVLLCEFVHVYVSTLFSRWLDPERLGDVYHYYNYAPAGYTLIQVEEVLCIVFVVTMLVERLREQRGTASNRGPF